MALPIEKVGSWVTEPVTMWFGRCDGCGKRRPRLALYDCYPEEGGGFLRQCARCMIESLSAKLEAFAQDKGALLLRKRLRWCRVCDRIQDAGGGHKDGCLGRWEEVTEAQAKDFFERMEEIAKEAPDGSG